MASYSDDADELLALSDAFMQTRESRPIQLTERQQQVVDRGGELAWEIEMRKALTLLAEMTSEYLGKEAIIAHNETLDVIAQLEAIPLPERLAAHRRAFNDAVNKQSGAINLAYLREFAKATAADIGRDLEPKTAPPAKPRKVLTARTRDVPVGLMDGLRGHKTITEQSWKYEDE